MAEGKGTKCCGCNQPCNLKDGSLCCPEECKRCILKGCKNKRECKCHDCNCGCEEFIKKNESCKKSGCPLCVVVCKEVEPGGKCICSTCRCGCEKAFMQGKPCHENGYNQCQDCQEKCKELQAGEDCICLLCNCGCYGVDCQCCSWCNPQTNCKGANTCNREDKHDTKCKGHSNNPSKEYDGGTYYNEHGVATGVCDKGSIVAYGVGKCRFKCTNCGKLCSQDRCIIWLRVVVVVSIILASLFVMRAMFPEKFHAMMTKIRTTFPVSLKHPVRPPSNLVGDIPPGEMNINRYAAFRPKAYAGLS